MIIPEYYKYDDLKMIYEFQRTIYQAVTGKAYTRHSTEYISEDIKHRLRMQLMQELRSDTINVI